MDDQVHVLGGEPVTVREMVADLFDEIPAMMRDLAADAAHQVELVVGVGHFPVTAGLAEADLVGQSQLAEQRQRPVDAGNVELGHRQRHLGVDVLGGEVVVGVAQHLPHHLPLRREAVALPAKPVSDIHTAIMPHPSPAVPCELMIRIELHTDLQRDVLDLILALIHDTTRIEGHRPVGEHKYSHLALGATGWVGVLAYDDDDLVGYAHTRWNSVRSTPRMALEVVVHPDYHGSDVARLLLWEARSVLGRAGGGTLFLWVHRVLDAHQTLAAQLGFRIQRELAFMTRPLDQALREPRVPPGVEVRPYRPDLDDDEFLRVNNAAFYGHPENGGWDHEEFTRRRKREWFSPDGLLMGWRGERLAGFHWTKWHGHDSEEVPAHEPVGEVYVLGVDPSEQGTGLGRALLLAGLRHLHGRGCRQAILYVDTAGTGALGLYESEGFVTQYHEVCYEDQVAPVLTHVDSDLLRPE